MPPPNTTYKTFVLQDIRFSLGEHVMVKVCGVVCVYVCVWYPLATLVVQSECEQCSNCLCIALLNQEVGGEKIPIFSAAV